MVRFSENVGTKSFSRAAALIPKLETLIILTLKTKNIFKMASDKNKVGSLEEEALKRRERLKSLKRKPSNQDDATSNKAYDITTLPK